MTSGYDPLLCLQISTETCSVPVLRWGFNIIIWLIKTQSQQETPLQLYHGIIITKGLPRLTFPQQLWSLAVNFPRQKIGLPLKYRGKVATG